MKRPRAPAPEQGGTGVNKVKGAIRQTKRLLARESTTPGARIEAERRLHALQRELEEKERAARARNLAARYHKVKFFGRSPSDLERQKLHRRIRSLARAAQANAQDKRTRAKLHDARILLHYVMTFPNDRRYVALFAEGNKEPVAPSADAPDRAQQSAAAFLGSVRKAVKRGELSATPEVELEAREEASRQQRKGVKRRRGAGQAPVQDQEESPTTSDDDQKAGEETDGEQSGEESDTDEDSQSQDSDVAAEKAPTPHGRGRGAAAVRPTQPAARAGSSVEEDEFFAV